MFVNDSIHSFGYFSPLNEPTRRRPAPILTGQQEDLFSGFSPVLPSFGYYKQFQDPIRRRASNLLDFNPFVPLTSETITVDKWYIPFADVIRAKPYKFTLPDFQYTISEIIWHLCIKHPMVPFAFGVLMGHFFWQSTSVYK